MHCAVAWILKSEMLLYQGPGEVIMITINIQASPIPMGHGVTTHDICVSYVFATHDLTFHS